MVASHSGKEISFSTLSCYFLIIQSLYGNVFTDLIRRRREADEIPVDFGDVQTILKYIIGRSD